MVKEFAQNGDVKLLVEERQIATSQFKRLLSKKGIFSLVRSASELSNEIYPIFLGSYDITYIQQIMQTSINYKKSSIMTISPANVKITLDDFIDDVNGELQIYRAKRNKYKIEEIVKDAVGDLHIRMSYYKKMRGKSALLKNKKKTLDIKIEKMNEEKKLLVDIRQNDNSDLREFEKFIDEINGVGVDQKVFNINKITLNTLSKENQIKFFDELIAYKYDDWKLDDVKGVDVKRSEVEENYDSDDPENLEVTSGDLVGINSAIFKGNSIRDTGIVKKFEDQGFYFVSMKFKYSYEKTWDSFIIDINFKGTTDGIKIDILKTYEKEDDNEKDIINILPVSEQENIIVTFQKASYKVYKKLLELQKKFR